MKTTETMMGQVFSRLTVLSMEENSNRKDVRWLCQCQCGKQKYISGKNLRSGHTRSCGCMQEDVRKMLRLRKFHETKST